MTTGTGAPSAGLPEGADADEGSGSHSGKMEDALDHAAASADAMATSDAANNNMEDLD